MNQVSRRKLVTTGVAGIAGMSGLAVATKLGQRYGLAARWLVSSLPARFRKLRSQTKLLLWAKPSSGCRTERLLTGGWWSMGWSSVRHRSRFLKSRAARSAARSLIWRAKRVGLILPSGSARLSRTFWTPWELCPRHDTLCTAPSNPSGGRVSTWPMRCIRKLLSRMA